MAKLRLLLIISCLVAAMKQAQSNWATTLAKSDKEAVTNLQFYFHDTLSGKNPTAVRVAQAADTNKSLSLFGALLVVDDPLTEGSDPNSKLVGRAQGLYGSACQDEVGLIMLLSYSFTDGAYKGSSISILGKNSAMSPVRELPIVGGTGVFRLARGYALASTHWLDVTTGDAIVWYNITVIH